MVEHPFRRFSRRNQSDVAWSPSGTRLAINDRTMLDIWDATSDKKITTLAGHVGPVNSVSWSPDGTHLVTTDAYREIRIWDLQSPGQSHSISTGSPVARIDWSNRADSLSSVAAGDLTISRWHTKDGERIETVSPLVSAGEDTGILSPDGRLWAHWSGANESKSITVRKVKSAAVHSVWTAGESFEPRSFAWSPKGTKLAVVIRSATSFDLECWYVNKEQQISRWIHRRINNGTDELTNPTWSPDGASVALVGLGDFGDNGNPVWSSHLHVVDVATGKRTRKRMFGNRSRYGGQIVALAWSPDCRFLAQGTTEGLVEILSPSASEKTVLCKAHDVPIRALAWSPNGLRLATAAASGTVKVMEPRQGNELLTLHVEGDSCGLVSWSPDGKKLAAVNDAGVIQIWDATRGYEFAEGGNRRAELAWVYYDQATEKTAELQPSYLRRALDLAPKALDYRYLRGHALARLGEFDAAAREFSAAVPGQLKQGLWMARWRAYALLGARDMATYRELQAALMDGVRDSEVWSKQLAVAWLGALIPGANDEFNAYVKELTALKLGKPTKLNDDRDGLYDVDMLRLGTMQYRLGRYAEAYETLAGLVANPDPSADTKGQYILTCTHYFLAMARNQLGHQFQASRQLVEANRCAERLAGVTEKWHWQVEFATLEREATALLGEPD